MLKLFSTEIKFFSIPIYIILLFIGLFCFNTFDVNHFLPIMLSLTGICFNYFLFNKINLNYHYRLPLLLYTLFTIAFYTTKIDIGVAINLIINPLILWILIKKENFSKNHHLLIGLLLSIGFIFLPTIWVSIFFILLHILTKSKYVSYDLFRLILGFGFGMLFYFEIMYLMNHQSIDTHFFPYFSSEINPNTKLFYPIFPIILIFIGCLFHLFSKMMVISPTNQFKLIFILLYTLTQIFIIIFYMDNENEYILFITFPFSVILGRELQHFKNYWLKETLLWVIIFSLFLYKLFTF